jgi:hypothetical protein
MPSATWADSPGGANISMASAFGIATQQMATLKSALRAKFDQRIASSFVSCVAQGSKPNATALYNVPTAERWPILVHSIGADFDLRR